MIYESELKALGQSGKPIDESEQLFLRVVRQKSYILDCLSRVVSSLAFLPYSLNYQLILTSLSLHTLGGSSGHQVFSGLRELGSHWTVRISQDLI